MTHGPPRKTVGIGDHRMASDLSREGGLVVAGRLYGLAWRWVPYLFVAVFAAILAVGLRPHILCDDAAITLRFASRLAAGRGFTYNDHERVLGASNPLYTLLLAGVASAGVDVETGARAVALGAFVATALLAYRITARLSGCLGGLLAGVLLPSWYFFRFQMLSGMESGLAVVLGLLVILMLLADQPGAVGIFLGLALWNKLDAGLLALAVAVSWLAVRWSLPLRIAAISSLVVAPWVLFATWYFGSPLPQSIVAKLGNNTGIPADRFWAVRFVVGTSLPLVGLGLTLFTPPVWRSLRARERLAVLALGGWLLLHGLALSVLWLGAPYPWYLVVLCAPLVILGCAGAAQLMRVSGRWRFVAGACALCALVAVGRSSLYDTYNRLRHGNPISAGEAFDFDRRLAGVFLARYADASEVVASSFGWVAYPIRNPFNDHSGLCSKVMRPSEAYYVTHGVPWDKGYKSPTGPSGYVPLATFNLASDLYPGYSWFTVFGARDSVAARSRERALQMRLFELPQPTSHSADYGLVNVRIIGNDMVAPPASGVTISVPSEAQPVALLFTPTIDAQVTTGGTEGVVFQVLVADAVVYAEHVLPREHRDLVMLPLHGPEDQGRLSLSLLTKRAENGGSLASTARWRNVKVVIGDAHLDLAGVGSAALVHEWVARNR
jgi:hypothetical protein